MRLNEFARFLEDLPENFLAEGYLYEGAKNTHLEHLEDEIINGGLEGAKDAYQALKGVYQMLEGHSNASHDVTVKWDGAPAIFCGINPENGNFFVGTKSVFAKKRPKILYTNEDVDEYYEGDLARKLKIALAYLPELGINGVLQGDMMFTKDDLETQKIDGEPSIVFQPNTIAYVVPLKSKLAKQIQNAELGIVFHTTYTGGPTLLDLEAQFGADVSELNNTPNVWFRDATYEDISGEGSLTAKESKYAEKELEYAWALIHSVDKQSWSLLTSTSDFVATFKKYNNQMIRAGQSIPDNSQDYVNDFFAFYESQYKEAMEKLKTEKGVQKKQEQLDKGLEFFASHKDQIVRLVELYKHLIKLKLFLVRKLEQLDQIGTFKREGNDFVATTPEGFVAIDRLSGNAVKLVNRLEFSMANFTSPKRWD